MRGGPGLRPGLRLGFVVAPRPLIERLTRERFLVDRQGDLALELAIAELRETAHDLPSDVGPLRWFEKLRDIAAGIRRERQKLALDVQRADQKREADAKRAAEMEEITRPKLRSRKKG